PTADDVYRGLLGASQRRGLPPQPARRTGHPDGHAAQRGYSETPPELGLPARALAGWVEVKELRDRLAGRVKVDFVLLDADAFVAHRLGGRERGTGPGERVEDNALAQRQHRSHDLAEERLRLQARVRGQRALRLPGRGRGDHVSERLVRARPAEAAGTPLLEVV